MEEKIGWDDYNQSQSQKVDKRPQYQAYKQWLKQNGVLIDSRVRYPSCFGNSLIGVSANKPIQKGRAIVAVPYNLLITVDKVKKVQYLNKIIEQNPDVFSPKEDRPFMILLLYISQEIIKGDKSFYAPYFKIAQGTNITNWTHWDMTTLESKQLTIHIKQYKEELEIIFLKFLRIYRKYDQIFPIEISNTHYKEIFEKAHGMISTRAFGWSLPSISMIPLADSFNHGLSYVDHYLVDKQLQTHQNFDHKQLLNGYVSHKLTANLSILNKPQLNPSSDQLDKIRKVKFSRKYKFIHKHKEILKATEQQLAPSDRPERVMKQQLKILHQQYKAGVRNFRQLHFYDSSCSEDNDTDEQTLTDQAFQQETFTLSERYPQKHQIITEKNKILHVRRYWKIYTDKTFKDEESEEGQEQENEQVDKAKQVQNVKEQSKTIREERNKSGESICSSSVSESSSDEEDEDFTWIQSRSNLENVYLIVQTRQLVKQNQQIFNFYGRRSNSFLLMSYNFVMGQDNYYDSFPLRMKTNLNSVKSMTPESILFQHKLSSKYSFTRQVRLKRNRISITLINHCRCWVVYFTKLETVGNITISLPFNIDVEKKTLGLAKDILKSVINSYMTTVKEDQQLLDKALQSKAAKHQTVTAIKIRMNYKRIILGQMELIDYCLQYLKRWKKRKVEIQESDMIIVRKIKDYLCQLQRGNL